MKILKIVLYVIGVAQLILGALYLFMPTGFHALQGLSELPADAAYPLSMLAGRFLIYGIGMFIIASNPVKHRVWLDGMIGIQIIDLAAGLFYTANGVVPLAASGIAMFDAALFIVLLAVFRKHAVEAEGK